MKICDLTQFYSPLSGGVKRYVHEKIRYIQAHTEDGEHVLIIPGDQTGCTEAERSRVYTIQSPLISRTSRYRALINLGAVGKIIEREKPDLLESGDPYQIAWKGISSARSLGIPVVAFYHSHFAEAYLRGTTRFLGRAVTDLTMSAARYYVRKLYNRFAATLVPSPELAHVLEEWGVRNVRSVKLGVNTKIFRPTPADAALTRESLGIAPEATVLLYVGRLAPEKNTITLFRSVALLQLRRPADFHLIVVGDGPERNALAELQATGARITHIQYSTDSTELARFYRAADLFVHPGTQETFGLVALESQACGTPVVGISGSFMDRIIFHGQDFWACENTAEALADAIENAFHLDLSALSAAAAHTAEEEYAWLRVFDDLFCIYREVCAAYTKP